MSVLPFTYKVTFVRHGETEHNLKGIIQGQGEHVDLNQNGTKQSICLGRSLKDVKFSHVYSSDLLRAKQTCDLILNESEDWKRRNKSIKMDKLLRERSFGLLEGLNWHNLDEEKQRILVSPEFKPDGGEDLTDLESRGINFFENLCSQLYIERKTSNFGVTNVLVVTHGGILRTIISGFKEYYKSSFPDEDSCVGPLNTSTSVFQITLLENYSTEIKEIIESTINSNKKLKISKGIEILCETVFDGSHLR